ncbi:MAG: peptide chain release factor subunit 1 [Candidatus Woesearchaeota archaeon]|nr:peptide chain release factor subunit 1 [Candidatus Woesearchaeota archaeon]
MLNKVEHWKTFINFYLALKIMEISAMQKRKLRKFIEELEGYKGRHTELVSVYIPKDYDMNKIINHLLDEQGTATNIKSKQTQKNVIASLERMIQHLKLFKATPPNGLAVFAGNVAEREGQIDVKVWSIEPPIPLNVRIYRCDKDFVLDPLKEMLETDDVFGLVVLDKREADIAQLKGKRIIPLTKTTSNVPGKTRAGGQSALRFQRLREGATKEFFKRVAEHMKEYFSDPALKGIIIGGPGHTKNEFVEGNILPEYIKNKIIAVKDVGYTGDYGLEELLEKSEDVLSEEQVAKEKKLLRTFFEALAKHPEAVSYGINEVYSLLERGAVETLLLSEELDDETIDKFEKKAQEFSTNIEMISDETSEGVQLVNLGKVAAFLRYNIDADQV